MFEKVSERLYIRPHEDYTDRPNLGLVIGETYSLLYDAGNSEKNVIQLKGELDRQGLKHPDLVALSHWHWDHTFGMKFWKVPVIAGTLTNAQLKKMTEWKWDDGSMDRRVEEKEDIVFCNEMIRREYPNREDIQVVSADIVFEGNMEIDLGGNMKCQLIHAKGPHSEDAVLLYVPSEKFLFLGDSNGKDLYGYPWHFDLEHEDQVVEEFQKIPYDREKVDAYLKILDTLDFEECIGGHGERMTKVQLYEPLK